MPKGGKPYPKGKKSGRALAAAMGLALAMAGPALAGGPLAWSDQPLRMTWDHVGVTSGSAIEERGVTALEAMYGSVATLTVGANTFELFLLSIGLGATGEVGSSTQFDGQFGLVWICTAQRGLCAEFPKVTRTVNAQDNRYLFGVTIRPSVLFASP